MIFFLVMCPPVEIIYQSFKFFPMLVFVIALWSLYTHDEIKLAAINTNFHVPSHSNTKVKCLMFYEGLNVPLFMLRSFWVQEVFGYSVSLLLFLPGKLS